MEKKTIYSLALLGLIFTVATVYAVTLNLDVELTEVQYSKCMNVTGNTYVSCEQYLEAKIPSMLVEKDYEKKHRLAYNFWIDHCAEDLECVIDVNAFISKEYPTTTSSTTTSSTTTTTKA